MRNSKQFHRRRMVWLDQLLGKADYPPSAFKVAYRIAMMCNENRGGEAWESCKAIGDAIGLSEASVIALVRRLHAGGDLSVRWGSRGRGYPNRYSMILKPQPTEVLITQKPQPAKVLGKAKNLRSAEKNLRNPEIKPQPAEEIFSKKIFSKRSSLEKHDAASTVDEPAGSLACAPDGALREPARGHSDEPSQSAVPDHVRSGPAEEQRLAEERKNRPTMEELIQRHPDVLGKIRQKRT
jgi:hypothetical protein